MRPPSHRGVTLIEVMISLTVLAVGLLGMMRLQVLGLTSNQGARAQMQAVELARELAAGLARVPFADDRLAPTDAFGSLLDPAAAALSRTYPYLRPIKGVRDDKYVRVLGSFERRWTVSDVGGAKLIAVSVVYRERAIPTPREIILYVGMRDQSNVQPAAFN
jgi:type IV pilus assembly protein PilV